MLLIGNLSLLSRQGSRAGTAWGHFKGNWVTTLVVTFVTSSRDRFKLQLFYNLQVQYVLYIQCCTVTLVKSKTYQLLLL